jgi:hypothetical protein
MPFVVAYACNPSYPGGKDLEEQSLRPTKRGKSYQDPHLNKISQAQWCAL